MLPHHRHAFLQSVMARGFMPHSEAQALYKKITDANDGSYLLISRPPLPPE